MRVKHLAFPKPCHCAAMHLLILSTTYGNAQMQYDANVCVCVCANWCFKANRFSKLTQPAQKRPPNPAAKLSFPYISRKVISGASKHRRTKPASPVFCARTRVHENCDATAVVQKTVKKHGSSKHQPHQEAQRQ